MVVSKEKKNWMNEKEVVKSWKEIISKVSMNERKNEML